MAKYFTSDWHLNESRIGAFNPFFRPFKSVEEQNSTIIDNINRIVGLEDELYVLGDIAMDDSGIELLAELECKNKFLIIGNHDEDKLDKLSQYFSTMKTEMRVNVQGIDCYLNHYPVNNVEDAFNIVGHIHGLWKVKPNMVNVGVDAWHFLPVSEKEIKFVYSQIQKSYDDNVFVHCK